MKKKTKILSVILCLVLVIGITGGLIANHYLGYHPSEWTVEGDDAVPEMDFEESLKSLDVMSNTWETAVPQTEVYTIISNHFSSPLPKGKKVKKAIVIGYDGCRTDLLRLLRSSKRSAVNQLLSEGGEAIFSYAGGVNFPAMNTQKTSTAPGWCSMLTGQLADVHHITENGQVKELEPRTLLLSLVEDKVIDKSAFYVSWKGHFSRDGATYNTEKEYIEKNKINSVFLRAKNDDGTKANIINDLKQKNCSDFIFSTLEYTDHAGHATGFSLQNKKYVSAFRDAEGTGMDIIEAVEARETYNEEDWLILITTDHGGIEKDHGGASFEERITFIVTNK